MQLSMIKKMGLCLLFSGISVMAYATTMTAQSVTCTGGGESFTVNGNEGCEYLMKDKGTIPTISRIDIDNQMVTIYDEDGEYSISLNNSNEFIQTMSSGDSLFLCDDSDEDCEDQAGRFANVRIEFQALKQEDTYQSAKLTMTLEDTKLNKTLTMTVNYLPE